MIVSAGDYGYRKYAGIFLSSLLKNGGVAPEEITYFVFDFSGDRERYEHNCYATMLYLLKVDRSVNIRMFAFEEMRAMVKRIKPFRAQNVDLDIIDYLKCRVFSHLKQPYLWLDSDMVVRKEISGLYRSCLRKDRFAMATRKADAFDLDHYFCFYSAYCGDKLPAALRRKGTFNGGLIFIPRDYTKLWFDIYRSVASPESGGVTGQGVWNTVFWLEKGIVMPEEYNYTYQGAGNRKAAVLHFLRGDKAKMSEYGY